MANNKTNKRQRTATSSKTEFFTFDQKDGIVSSIDCPPRSPSSMSTTRTPDKHNHVPALSLLPESDTHQHGDHLVSEVVSDVSSVDLSTRGRSRANSDDYIPIPSHVTTTNVSGQSFPVSSVVRPVSSTGSGSGIFFEGQELLSTSPVNGSALDNRDNKQVVIPTFFDTNRVVHTVDDAATTSSEQQGMVYDLVPSSLRSRATAFTPLLTSPVLLNRDVASYLLKEQGHVDRNNDNTSMNGGATTNVDASIKSKSTTKVSKAESDGMMTKPCKMKKKPVTPSLQLDQYVIHMKTQRLRCYLKKRAAERRAIRRAENERNSGRTAAFRSSADSGCSGMLSSSTRSGATSPIADVISATVPQTGIKFQLPMPTSSCTSTATTNPLGLNNTVSYDTATDATTHAPTPNPTATDHNHLSSLNESAPLSACSQDVLDAAVALTRCLSTKHA